MVRLFAVAVSIGMFWGSSVPAQHAASVVAGKWELTVTGRPTRLLELTADGASVTGTLTKDGSTTATVTGELKGNNLIFETKARDEYFTVLVDGGGMHGTYVYNGGSPETSYKTGVILRRPAR